MSDDDTRDGFVEITGLGEDGEVWVPVVVVAAHVHPAIEHYLFVIDRYYYTALPYLLSSTEYEAIDRHRSRYVTEGKEKIN